MAEDMTRGFDELAKELEEIAKHADESHRRQALDDGAEIIVDRAREIVPVDTGLLSRSGIVKGNNTGDAIEVGWTKDGFYGRFLENGTTKMAPRPHISPAYEQTKTQVNEKMLATMKLK